MPSYKEPAIGADGKPIVLKEIEWIVLTTEQATGLAADTDRIAGVIEEARAFDGYTYIVKMLRSTAKMLFKNKRISAKQLATIQKAFNQSIGEDLYVKGLEFYLIQNVEKMKKSMKIKETREANERRDK